MIDYYSEQLGLLRSAGWKAHADEFEECVRTLRVLHTWARVDDVLDPVEVQVLIERALAPFTPNAEVRREMDTANKANIVCIDNKGREWKRHRFGVHGLCERCAVPKRAWDKTAARRRAGKRLVGRNGKVVELTNKESK